MLMPMGGGVADRLRKFTTVLTQVAETVGAGASTIALPAGSRAGDLAVLFDYTASNDNNIGSSVVPSGFTSILEHLNTGSQYSRCRVSYKILTASDQGGTIITGTNLGTARLKILLVLRGNVAFQSVAVSAIDARFNNDNPGAVFLSASEVNAQGPSIALATVFCSNLFSGYVKAGWQGGTEAGYTLVSGSLIGEVGYVLYDEGDTPAGDLTADAPGIGLGCADAIFALNLG